MSAYLLQRDIETKAGRLYRKSNLGSAAIHYALVAEKTEADDEWAQQQAYADCGGALVLHVLDLKITGWVKGFPYPPHPWEMKLCKM